MQTVIDLLKLLKTYFIPLIVRWLLKIGGGVLIYAGWNTEDELTSVIGGIVSIILGVVTSLLNKKSDLAKEPN